MSLWTNVKRVSRYGFIGFIRNGLVSVAAVFILIIALFFQANLMISNAAMTQTLEELKQKVGITAYFQPTATEDQVMATKQALEALPEVALVTYTSRDQALADFRERHANDQLTLQALDELGENPLGASLDVQAKEPSQYETIATFLDARQTEGTSGIDKVNYSDNRLAIERLGAIIDSSQKNGITKEIILGICALIIVFNTIRLTIYTARDEIGVMNLVGAGHWYVRGPFLVGGMFYGLIAAVIVLVLMYPILRFYPVLIGLDPTAEILFGSFDSFGYYIDNFVLFFFSIVGAGIGLGVVSSYLSVRRYLKM
ncbi:ABC transporter permease [Candidatus Parcubacteria bacterium]|nr:MAG: ABC transporter permease [Candidatus Parcubacteria bacterium]